jgi:hypothetical protein
MVFSILFGGAKADKPWLLEEPSEEVKQQATTYGREEEYYPALRKRLEEQEAYARGQGASDYLAQERLAEDYQRTLRGEGISLAEQQMRAGQAQAMQQAAQMAASSRGGTAGLMMAQRSAQQQAALGTAGVARDAAMLRAKEVAEARGQYGGLLTSMRGMSQQQQQAMLEAQMRATEADAATRAGLMREMYQNYRQSMQSEAAKEAAEKQKQAQVYGSAVQGGAVLVAPHLAPVKP